MPSSLPERQPEGLEDTGTLRWAVRSDGRSGFVFVNWHQPHVPLPACRDVELVVELPDGRVGLGPLDVPAGTLARWPFNLDLGGITLSTATASALTILADGTLVLVAETGIDVELTAGPGVTFSGTGLRTHDGYRFSSVIGGIAHLTMGDEVVSVVVVAAGDADRLWVVDGVDGRWALLCDQPVWTDGGKLVVLADRRPDVQLVQAAGGQELELQPEGPARRPVPVVARLIREGREPRPEYGRFSGRASAPGDGVIAELAAVYELEDVGRALPATRRLLEGEWAGDVAQLCVDGEVVADRFWDGTPWVIDLDTLHGAEAGRVSIRILALHPEAPVWLDAVALNRRRAGAGPLLGLDAVTLTALTHWSTSLADL